MDHEQPPVVQKFSRLEVELEFVQCLANPYYLNYLAQSQYFDNPAFVAYLDYLDYFRQPEYTKLLTYPSYTLKALELLKQPAFRRDIMNPFLAKQMAEDGIAGVTAAMDEMRRRGELVPPLGASDALGMQGAAGENSNAGGGDAQSMTGTTGSARTNGNGRA